MYFFSHTNTQIVHTTYIKGFKDPMFCASIYLKTFELVRLSVLMSAMLDFSNSFQILLISEALDHLHMSVF